MRMRMRPWTDREIASCPFFIDEPGKMLGRWKSLFANGAPMWLEIGCGKGVSTSVMARENPGVNIVAIDEVRHVLACLSRNIKAAYDGSAAGNILAAAVDATRLDDVFGNGDLFERIIISFPNPWNERAKHHKRRLTHPRQLMLYRGILADHGRLYFKTDDRSFFLASKRYLDECGFSIIFETDDLENSGYSPNYVSEHEKMFMEKGMKINFLIAEMETEFDPSSIKERMPRVSVANESRL